MTKHKRHDSGVPSSVLDTAPSTSRSAHQTSPSLQRNAWKTSYSQGLADSHAHSNAVRSLYSHSDGEESTTSNARAMPSPHLQGSSPSGLHPSSMSQLSLLSPQSHAAKASLHSSEAFFSIRGVRIKVKRSHTKLSWKPATKAVDSFCGGPLRFAKRRIPFDEVLSCHLVPKSSLNSTTHLGDCLGCLPTIPGFGSDANEEGFHSLIVYSLGRPTRRGSNPNEWFLQEDVLSSTSLDQVNEWAYAINHAVALNHERPKNLLVFVNPYSGSGSSSRVWAEVVQPVFEKSRIKFTVIETEHQDHAKEYVASMQPHELATYQGLVAIGGDGVFQELVRGLLVHRSTQGPAGASISQRMRIGHIPGGSTDAVAFSLHNTRSAQAAALHIALGDRLPLDVARLECEDGSSRHFVCQAAYGFLGDVMKASEAFRALGPTRYDLVGALRFVQLNSYRVKLSYKMARNTSMDPMSICESGCEFCRMAGIEQAAATTAYRPHAYHVGGEHRQLASFGRKSGGHASSSGGSTASGDEATPASSSSSFQGRKGSLPLSTPLIPSPSLTSSDAMPVGSVPVSTGGAGTATQPSHPYHFSKLSLEVPRTDHSLGSLLPLSGHNNGSHVTPKPGPLTSPSSVTPHVGNMPHYQVDLTTPMSSSSVSVSATQPLLPLGSSNHRFGDAAACEEGWTLVEGDFASINVVVAPCRSDKSKRGLIPNGHLSDGRMYLVMVKKCNHLQWLRFLLQLSSRGLVDLCLPYVRVVPVEGVKLRTVGPESSWNVDGELLTDNNVAIRVHRGLVDVFSRGVENPEALKRGLD